MRIFYIDENTDFDALFGRSTEPTEAKDSSTEPTETKDSSTEPTEAKDSSTEPTEAKDSSTEPTEPTNDGGDVYRLLYALFGE
jgi:hypothetical protein